MDDTWFQQDGATWRTTRETIRSLHESYPVFVFWIRIGHPVRRCTFFLLDFSKSKIYGNTSKKEIERNSTTFTQNGDEKFQRKSAYVGKAVEAIYAVPYITLYFTIINKKFLILQTYVFSIEISFCVNFGTFFFILSSFQRRFCDLLLVILKCRERDRQRNNLSVSRSSFILAMHLERYSSWTSAKLALPR